MSEKKEKLGILFLTLLTWNTENAKQFETKLT